MTPQIALTMGIIVVALIIFATEKLRVDVVALLVLLTVGLTGLVDKKRSLRVFQIRQLLLYGRYTLSLAGCSKQAWRIIWGSSSCGLLETVK